MYYVYICAALTTRARFTSNTLTAKWFEQLTSERRVLRYSRGQPMRSFERILGRRAEALDCTIYALAVRGLVSVDLTRRENELRDVATAPKNAGRDSL